MNLTYDEIEQFINICVEMNSELLNEKASYPKSLQEIYKWLKETDYSKSQEILNIILYKKKQVISKSHDITKITSEFKEVFLSGQERENARISKFKYRILSTLPK